MVCGVKLRRFISSIMRRRKGVMCGSFASGDVNLGRILRKQKPGPKGLAKN